MSVIPASGAAHTPETDAAARTPAGELDAGAREIERIRRENQRRAVEDPPDLFGWNRPVTQFHRMQLSRACIHALVREGCFPLAGKRIADIGCGPGVWLLNFAQWEARCRDLAGIDIDDDLVAEARLKLPAADLHAGDARRLPWADACFDLVSQFTVFTSILDAAVKRTVAAEMLRILKPGGLILWYDFRFDNPRNSQVRGVKAAEIRDLFPGCSVRLDKVTLAPPILRQIVPVSWVLALLLEKAPLLRTHYLAMIRKPAL